jgi:tetratricopeptide (TPR) repeat protein
MRRWFLSYHSPDQALAERLKAAIERKDEGAVVFFAPTSLRAGGRWVPALAGAIEEAAAFVLLVTDRGIGRWQEIEYEAAFDKHLNSPDFPIVLMLLEGQAAPRLSFLKQLHWIVSSDPASEKDVARLIDAVNSGGDAKPREPWRYTSPYRGLSAMEEKDSDYFFGRERETVEVLSVLAAESNRLPVLLGNSGVGKSSLAQAGVIAALRRQAWPERITSAGVWPAAFKGSRRWCFLALKPGDEPIKALVEAFLRAWQYDATDPVWEERQKGWVDRLSDGRATLRGLLDATERRYEQIGQPKPPAFFLYVDQGEELYVRGERQRCRFSELLAQAIADMRLVALMSMRSDFLGYLQNDEPLFTVHRKIDVPPLRETELSTVIREPALQLSARFESEELVAVITRRSLEDSAKDVGALPLLSYTLDDMWTEMVHRGDGVLRLRAEAFELGGVLAERANAFMARNPNSEGALRRVLTIRLATVRKEGDPTRRRAVRSEFSDAEWRLVTELADHPNRLLVTVTPEGSEPFAEVAHEAIFRRWDKLREWINSEREFLAWRSTLDDDRHRWERAPEGSKNDALLLGFALAQAQGWLGQRGEDLSNVDREFIDLSQKAEAGRRQASQIQRKTAEQEMQLLDEARYEMEHQAQARYEMEHQASVGSRDPDIAASSRYYTLKTNPWDDVRYHWDEARSHARERYYGRAFAEYRIAIQLGKDLLRRDPANAKRQAALASLYEATGGLLKREKYFTLALEQYRMGYTLRRELAFKEATNPERQSRFAAAGKSIADLLVALNHDLDGAVKLYREAIETLDEFRPHYDRDIFRCYIKIGDTLKSRGDWQGAWEGYRLASAIAREAAANDATSVMWQKNLAGSYANIGDFLITQGRSPEALEHYKEALEFVSALAAKNPENVGWATFMESLKAKVQTLQSKH